MASVFGGIEIAPPIEVFNLTAQYNEDNHPQKVNLGVGGKVKVKGMVGVGWIKNTSNDRQGWEGVEAWSSYDGNVSWL